MMMMMTMTMTMMMMMMTLTQNVRPTSFCISCANAMFFAPCSCI
jgi:hypothetical protein